MSEKFESSPNYPKKGQNAIQSYLGRCSQDPKEAEDIIVRLKAQGVPFEKILQSIRDKANKAIETLNL